LKLKDQREEGKEGTILLCSRFQHKSIHIHRQKVPISNPPNKQMLTNQMILKLICKTTAFIFQRHVFKDGHELRESVTHNPHRRKNW
jgi:hypothetical protein